MKNDVIDVLWVEPDNDGQNNNRHFTSLFFIEEEEIVYYVKREEKQRFRRRARLAARAKRERVEIAALSVMYIIFHNLTIVNSALWCLYSGAKVMISSPRVESTYF